MTTTEEIVTGGIDTHADTHHVAVINQFGRHVADKEFPAIGSGYRKIIAFLKQYEVPPLSVLKARAATAQS